MPELSPEILNFLKYFLQQPQRFDAGQQTTDIQQGGAVGGGGEQVPGLGSNDAFASFLKNFNFGDIGGSAAGPQIKKLSFFS